MIPLGATLDGDGVRFAVFSQNGARAWVCLYDPADPAREIGRHELRGRDAHVFHGRVSGVGPGALYGFRVDGPWDPRAGHRFNAAKLLLDPYARAIEGDLAWDGPVFGHGPGDDPDQRDSAPAVPRSAVVDGSFAWDDDRPPSVPWSETILYELHVRGFSAANLEVPAALRGTYAGLAHPASIAHLRRLGVTAVELLPVHHHLDEESLVRRGLRNYWGYNSIGFFAPERRYASARDAAGSVREWKSMVKALHAAGIEVLLDVVYNHTAEGNHLGPTLCFRGLDDATYYHLDPADRRRCLDFTGTGNSFNLGNLYPLRLVMDSLRYWVEEMHVDGFRFDLAPELARVGPEFPRSWAAFVQAAHQDPALSRVKLIAEPWDLGQEGYQLGRFPVLWSEWNDRFRDGARRAWRDGTGGRELRARLLGSPDVFRAGGRRPHASVNFVTCHDGFTLEDLVSYARKHNQRNGEDNRDGAGDNLSSNHGVEGPTSDAVVNAARERTRRNLLATLLLARGTPMLLAGDELGRTQQGNNNAYCVDDETTWLDWNLDGARASLRDFVARLVRLRAELAPALEDAWPGDATAATAVQVLAADGTDVTAPEADVPACFAVHAESDARAWLIVVNPTAEAVAFRLPPGEWRARLDTGGGDEGAATGTRPIAGRSVVVLAS